MNGYAGKIIRIDLTTAAVSHIATADYEKWGGGHGIGSALFYDIAIREKGLNLEEMDHDSSTDGGFHPDNVLTIMTSPLSATGVPAATGRTEIQGIGVQSYPIGWFTRSNFGGRFGSMLKFAGYDGIVIEGQAQTPVWIDIRDDSIRIRPCGDLDLWGKDTVDTQKLIWDFVTDDAGDDWNQPEGVKSRTTQRPAVLTIGPAGENKSRMACLIHDASNAAGQGGFGGIWGAKNLKAISVIGTGTVPTNNPADLVALRVFQKNNYHYDIRKAETFYATKTWERHNSPPSSSELYSNFMKPPGGDTTPSDDGSAQPVNLATLSSRNEDKRPVACMGCHAGCRARFASGKANEASCETTQFYMDANTQQISVEAVELLNRYGFNAFELAMGLLYLKMLYRRGVLGSSGQEIETDLDFSDYGSLDFVQKFLATIAKRDTPFGNIVAEGFIRAAKQWQRESDNGKFIFLPYWGIMVHYDPRAELEWGYGSILGDRDINEHCINSIQWHSFIYGVMPFAEGRVTAEETVDIFTEKMVPHADAYADAEGRMQMLNFSTENMYSSHIARLVSWHRHYTRYYKQSLLFCDWRWPDFVNTEREDNKGSSGIAEPNFIKAVTGQTVSFADGVRIGQKIWNLDNAIWTLQGRHRDMVHFADWVYNKNAMRVSTMMFKWPTYKPDAAPKKRWRYRDVGARHIDKDEFEKFKTRFYTIEGWDPATGWPTRATLESLGMQDVAETLMENGKGA